MSKRPGGRPARPTPKAATAPREWWREWWDRAGPFDLAACCALVALAAAGYLLLPGGSGLRVALAVPVLFFVPGYVLIEATSVTPTAGRRRAIHAWLAIGVSPAVVGLLGLSTAFLPGGFQGGSIVGVVTGACLALAGCAFWRRQRASARALQPRSRDVHPTAGP